MIIPVYLLFLLNGVNSFTSSYNPKLYNKLFMNYKRGMNDNNVTIINPKTTGIFIYYPRENYTNNNSNFLNIYKKLLHLDEEDEPDDFYTPFEEPKKEETNWYKNKNKKEEFKKVFQNSGFKKKNNDDESFNGFEILKTPTHDFSDIGGYDDIKNELMQISDILTNFEKYSKYNIRLPKGLILEGPPGNGKTLLAKGFSGEVNASFIPVSGSEFVEKYVGVGALRIRELFNLAETNIPCIIFIDEIDALGRKRGDDLTSSNSEKDQALNQLLVRLDGFKTSNGIFVIGATNRYDMLDPALTRPGRIDKHIYVSNPDENTRKRIIEIHMQGKPMSSNINMEYIQYLTDGFSGAQIENLLNEAMLNALRSNREQITKYDLDLVTNKIISGSQTSNHCFTNDTIERIAIHELGHAIVGYFSNNHAKLSRVCLNLNSPSTPGYTVFESHNNNLLTKESLEEHLAVLLAGRIAEEVFFGSSITTGARKDLEEAFNLAKNMVTIYGMGKQKIYPGFSDQSKYSIEQEIIKLIEESEEKSKNIIKSNDKKILILSEMLKQTNILKYDEIKKIIEG
jgi:cell division protease FtsH